MPSDLLKFKAYLDSETAGDAALHHHLDGDALDRLTQEIADMPINLTINRRGHIIAASLWRGSDEEVGT